MVSFYAAAIGVVFLLFTASGSAGALLDEVESGTLDRVLSSRVTMTGLMLGKPTFNSLLAFLQLVVMFLWGWAVFKLDFWSHIPGCRARARGTGCNRALIWFQRHIRYKQPASRKGLTLNLPWAARTPQCLRSTERPSTFRLQPQLRQIDVR